MEGILFILTASEAIKSSDMQYRIMFEANATSHWSEQLCGGEMSILGPDVVFTASMEEKNCMVTAFFKISYFCFVFN